MKKLILVGLCLLLFTGGVFAQNMAFGGGVLFNGSWTVSKAGSDNAYWDGTWYLLDSGSQTLTRQGFGGFVFFGLGRYAELNFGFLYKNPSKYVVDLNYTGYGNENYEPYGSLIDGALALQFGAYFKYPFVLSDRIVLFPTAGVDYELTLADATEGWWDDLWLRAGLGVDIFVTQKAFIRVHALYGYGVIIGYEGSILENEDQWFYNGAESCFSHGFIFKVGVGFMF